MENKVISREYVEKNYINKDVIREKLKWLDEEGYWEFITNRDLTLCCEILRSILEDK